MPLSVGSFMRFYIEEGKGNVQVGSFVSRNGPVTVRLPGGSVIKGVLINLIAIWGEGGNPEDFLGITLFSGKTEGGKVVANRV